MSKQSSLQLSGPLFQLQESGVSSSSRKWILPSSKMPGAICQTLLSLGAQKNFVNFSSYAQAEWEKSPEQFNEEYYKRVVVKAMLFRRTEELVSDQSWYQGGYRANIASFDTIAKFAHLIQFEGTGDAFDFKACWTRQSLSPAIESQFIINCVRGSLRSLFRTAGCKTSLNGRKRKFAGAVYRAFAYRYRKNWPKS